MRHIKLCALLAIAFGFLCLALQTAWAAGFGGQATPPQESAAIQALDLSPALFVENKGQWDAPVRYGFDGRAVRVSFTDAGPVFQMLKGDGAGEGAKVSRTAFSATFVGAKRIRPTGLDPSSTKASYYRGKDSSKWQRGAPTFTKLAYNGLYDGIDLHVCARPSGLKYEFHVAPGASWKQIVVRYSGIERLSIDEKGALHVGTSLGEIVDAAPVVYQETASGRIEVPARYTLVGDDSYRFEITGHFDAALPLVIDPEITWGSYLGGSDDDYGYAIAVDASGNCYLTGYTYSRDFPASGGYDSTFNSGGDYCDVFVAKVTPAGQLAWATYLGGFNRERGRGIAVDAAGSCYVAGDTSSGDFPTQGAYQTVYGGGESDAFVAKFAPSGALSWSTFLGGTQFDEGPAIAVDAAGNCCAAVSETLEFAPLTGSSDAVALPGEGAYLARFTPSGQLAWVTRIGGDAVGSATGVAIDGLGNCYGAGSTGLFRVIVTTAGAVPPRITGFVTKVTPWGEAQWTTNLMNTLDTWAYAVTADAYGNCYVTGAMDSPSPQVKSGSGVVFSGGYNAFVARLTTSGEVAWTRFIGGADDDRGSAIALDGVGNCYIAGNTCSADFPASGGFDNNIAGMTDGFVARVSPSGQFMWSSFLGGGDDEIACGIAADKYGNCYVTGSTYSRDFPTPGGFSRIARGDSNAFVVKVAPHTASKVNWLEITRFQMGLPATPGRDSFVLQGACNMWPGDAPPAVTLRLDSTWAILVDSSSWKRSGKSGVYTAKQGGVTCKMTAWPNGSSKLLFQFSGSGQWLKGNFSYESMVPVRLKIGSAFDETVRANMATAKNAVAKFTLPAQLPAFCIEKLTFMRKGGAVGHDALTFGAKLFFANAFDPAHDRVTMKIGPYSLTIPPGTMPAAKNGVVKYASTTATGRLTFQMNNNTGALALTATGIDLSSVSQETEVTLSVTNHGSAPWDYWVFLSKNKTGTLYKY